MPMFEYQCKSCLREFEELVFGDELPTCPHCHSANTEKLLSRPCACRREGGRLGRRLFRLFRRLLRLLRPLIRHARGLSEAAAHK